MYVGRDGHELSRNEIQSVAEHFKRARISSECSSKNESNITLEKFIF